MFLNISGNCFLIWFWNERNFWRLAEKYWQASGTSKTCLPARRDNWNYVFKEIKKVFLKDLTFSTGKKDVGRLWGLPQAPREMEAFERREATNTLLFLFFFKNRSHYAICIVNCPSIWSLWSIPFSLDCNLRLIFLNLVYLDVASTFCKYICRHQAMNRKTKTTEKMMNDERTFTFINKSFSPSFLQLVICLYSEVVLDFSFGHWKCPNREWGKGHIS